MFSSTAAGLVGCVVLCASGAAAYTVIHDIGSMGTHTSVIDFENLTEGTISGPLEIDGVTFGCNRGLSVVDLSPWPINGTHVESLALYPNEECNVCAPVFTLVIDFAEPVNEVGFGWFDPNLDGNVARFFGVEGELLAAVEPVVGPTWGVHADFVGVRFEHDVISCVKVIPGHTGDVYAVDNVTWGRLVPAPGALAALGLALVCRRRR